MDGDVDKKFFINMATHNMHGDGVLVIGNQLALLWVKYGWVAIINNFTYGKTSRVKLTDLGESILDFDKL